MQNQRVGLFAVTVRPAVLTALTAGIAIFAAKVVNAGDLPTRWWALSSYSA
jgi:hypothetical protein